MSKPLVIEHGNVRFIASPDGNRAELRLPIDGVDTWREARWERRVTSTHCSSRYGMRDAYGLALRPVLRDGEMLRETADGRMEIRTVSGGSA